MGLLLELREENVARQENSKDKKQTKKKEDAGETIDNGKDSSGEIKANKNDDNVKTMTKEKDVSEDVMGKENENCNDETDELQVCDKHSCTNSANKKCSRCRLVHYCSVQCMKDCWPKHKLECRRPCIEGVRVEEREGKGQGLIACRDFAPGEVIIQEDPLLVTVEGEPVVNILKRFDGLQKEEQQLLLALYDPQQPEVPGVKEEKHKSVMRILWANSLQLCSFPELGIAGTALYSTICRINHCCAPNAAWSWLKNDARKRKKVVRAIRKVKTGEEITVSYLPSSAGTTGCFEQLVPTMRLHPLHKSTKRG